MSQASGKYLKSGELMSRGTSRLLVVDVQEKLVSRIFECDRLLANCCRLARAANILQVPAFVTEQYAKGLGPTVPQLAELLPPPPDKLRFSCAEALNWGMATEQTDDRFQVVVAGIEAHVCILQTVLDLLSHGYQVFVPADAVSSRGELNWRIALERMAGCGATITSTESVLFEWCEVAGTPEFKQISQLVKDGP